MRYYTLFIDLALGYSGTVLLYMMGQIKPSGGDRITQLLQIAVAISTIAKLAYDVYKSEKERNRSATSPRLPESRKRGMRIGRKKRSKQQ